MGAAFILLTQRGSFSLLPEKTTYLDLAAVLLGAVSVIVAVFGGVLALLALWGFKQLKTDAISAAALAGTAEVKEQVEKGALRDYIHGEIDEMIKAEIASPEMHGKLDDLAKDIIDRYLKSADFEQRLRDQIDQAGQGNVVDRELDEEEEV